MHKLRLRLSNKMRSPKFGKLNPLKGFGRIFSKTALVELFKSLFKVAIVTIIAYQTAKGHWDEIPPLMGFSVGQTLSFMGQVMLEIMFDIHSKNNIARCIITRDTVEHKAEPIFEPDKATA